MARPKTWMITTSLGCILVALGGAVASNIAFKLPFQLTGPAASGGQGTGNNLISLPYRPKAALTNAYQLMLDIGGGSITPVNNITKYNTTNDALIVYNGRMTSPTPTPFALAAGEAYMVKMNGNVNYVIVGAHDSTVAVQLNAPGSGSASGKYWLAVPYNATAATALDLMLDIGGGSITPVNSVARYNRTNDTLIAYNGRMTSPTPTPFALTAGEGYFVQMNSTVSYVPAHY